MLIFAQYKIQRKFFIRPLPFASASVKIHNMIYDRQRIDIESNRKQ